MSTSESFPGAGKPSKPGGGEAAGAAGIVAPVHAGGRIWKSSLAAAEPEVRQPLYINFDERGRMWVVQYLQYPFPAGLEGRQVRPVHPRAVFDKVPAAAAEP